MLVLQCQECAGFYHQTNGLASGAGEYHCLPFPNSPDDAQAALSGFDRDEQNRLKQEAFYKVGTRFFNKKGYAGTSLDEIAEHLKVSKGAFYYHIKSKDELLLACYERSLAISERIHEQINNTSISGIEKLEQVCRRGFHIQNSEDGPIIRYNTITALPIERRKSVLKRNAELSKSFQQIIDAGIEDGSIRPVNSFVAENLISGASNAAMDIKLWRRIDDVDTAGIEYFDVLLNGLKPRSS